MSTPNAPRIGVVIPVYNHERYVADAVRSVLAQTIDNLELVLIDDGSRDGSVDAARSACEEFPGRRARIIEQENRGAHDAIMRGIESIDTPLVAVLNSDDLYETDRFERMLPHLRSELAIAFSRLSLIDDTGSQLPADHAWTQWYERARSAAATEPTIGFALMVHNFSVTSGNFVFTRALYESLRGFGDQKFAHDWDFLIRATALTEPVFVDEKLMRYRVHDSNTTESVRGRLQTECRAAMDRLAERLANGDGTNALAPCQPNWPAYWDRFGDRQPFYSAGGRMRDEPWYAALSARPALRG